MDSSRNSARPLNYFQQSPVRGQLEHPDGYSRSGWRFLQCTDTPNELRVLLPPRTAAYYSQLLKAETNELAKGDGNASWERILQIRHLKDRMIRKCQRLARASAPAPTNKTVARAMFFTVHAPPDFRLKEMERWFREQGAVFARESDVQQGGQVAGASQLSRRGTSSSYRHAPSQQPPEKPTVRRSDTRGHTTTTHAPAVSSSSQHRRHASSAQAPSVAREPERKPPARARSVERKRSAASDVSTQSRSMVRLAAQSPDPLPIPYRMHDPTVEPLSSPEPEPELQPFQEDLAPVFPDDAPMVSSPEPVVSSPDLSISPPNGQLPTIHEDGGAPGTTHRPLPRRRSSLKRANSISKLSVGSNTKSVAWAMDRDWIEQMSKYMKTANEAEVLGHELEGLRAEYQQKVAAMRGLVRSVSEASERIRFEMEQLHRNEVAVRAHEDKLLATISQLESKETQFREKVLSVLEETKRVVHMCDKKRETHEM